MWDDLAQVSLRYLKPNDSVYVSGRLSSYEKIDANGKREILHRVCPIPRLVAHYFRSLIS